MESHETDIGLTEETIAAAQIAAFTERLSPINEVGVGYRLRLIRQGWSEESADKIAAAFVAAATQASVEETVAVARTAQNRKAL